MNMLFKHPSANELITAVQQFLMDEVTPQVDKRTAFQLRIAHNILSIVARELCQGEAFNKLATKELSQLLNRNEENIDQLNSALCNAIQQAEFSLDDPQLMAALRRITQAKVEIDNPGYSGLKQAKSKNNATSS